MNIVIFSKDRACQLDLLLRSIGNTGEDVTVLYTTSEDKFADGYFSLEDECFDSFDMTYFWRETSFKIDLLSIVSLPEKYTMFLTDDDIVIQPDVFELICDDIDKFDWPDNLCCTSLRLNPYMTYCYTLSRVQRPPLMVGNCWAWRSADADYGYPMSLDGHIFRTSDILPLLQKLNYNNPNELEGQLARHPINRPKMMCVDKSVIVNNPVNRVQTVNQNRCGSVDAKFLNDEFLKGKRIDLQPFLGFEPNACHVELPITLI